MTRFRQLLNGYGAFLALLEDAAEKQGGGFVLDRQYVVSLVEQVAELADSVLFDLNVLTSQRHLATYEAADRLRAELRALLAQEPHGSLIDRSVGRSVQIPPVSPRVLAGALSRAEVLYRERGQVACRGAAAGPVCNLAGAPDREAIPEGSVLVASELDLEERVTAAVKKAAAILLDRGSVTGVTARLARELRIPAIVGLGNATERLASGTDVTVDADENVVYRGRIPELLDYQRSIRWGDEEEPEYRLLRAVRRAAFPLTLAERSVEPTFEECRTFHDLVHVAHSLAGASVAGALRSRPGASIRLPDLPWCVVRVSELGGAPDDGSVREVSSVPLKLFLNGLTAGRARTGNREPSERVLDVAATGEHALCAMALPHGFDVLDATLGHGDEDNAIYCRVAPQGEADPAGARGTMALGVLRRLGFAVARTPREVSGWIRCLPSAEAAEKVRILGRLFASLSELEDSGSAGDASSVETFLREGA